MWWQESAEAGALPSVQPHAPSPGTVVPCASGLEGARQTGCDAGARRSGESPQCSGLRSWLAAGQEKSPRPIARPWSTSWVPSALSLLGSWHSGSITATTRRTPAASVPGNGDAGVERGALAGPRPAQTHGAPHSPICSGWTTHTSSGCGRELLSWGAPSSSQATPGQLGDLSAIMRDG